MSALRDAYELIRDPEHWTQAVLARTVEGYEVEPDDLSAVQWCAEGALYKCGAMISPLLDVVAALFPREDGGRMTLYALNDELGHEAVMQVFEKALVETEGSL